MRTKRTLINLVYTLGQSLVLLLLGLVTRKLFVTNFDAFVPGYSDTINNIFNFFSIAEFGVGSVISYRLYEQIAAKDIDRISRYMSLYKWAYRAIGAFIALMAVICAFFLPLLVVQEQEPDWLMVYGIYAMTALSTLSSYFLVTRRLMYTCTQQGYVCTKIDLGFNVATSLAKIAIALWIPNYFLYFGIQILFNTLANVVVARRYRKDFPELYDVKVSLSDFKDLGIFHDLRYYLVHKLSNTIYGSSDNIVITSMRGAALVTQTGNYSTISTSVNNICNKILDSFAAAIGSIVYDRDAEADGHAKAVFWGLDLFSYCFGSFVAVAYFCLFQPFIRLWMGESYLLPMAYVFWFCMNEYIGWNHRMLGSYRAVLGHFEEDQWFMVASAASNVLLSFALVIPFGLAGVVGATVFAHCLMWIGRARVVCRHYMKGCGWRYLGLQLLHWVTLFAIMFLTARLCELCGQGILAFIGKVCLVAVVPNLCNLLLYGWTSDAAYLRGRGLELVRKLSGRLHKGENQ